MKTDWTVATLKLQITNIFLKRWKIPPPWKLCKGLGILPVLHRPGEPLPVFQVPIAQVRTNTNPGLQAPGIRQV